ncbi:MAG TPA: thiamine phosphate synthase [Rhizomicrobium sp.]|nr:thiamine phosphate synthase [Rhizomicrobium sp.]
MAGRLPALVLMTDDERLADPLTAAAALPKGAMVIVRAREGARRAELARAMLALARRRELFVLIADDPALASRLGADGLHLPQVRSHEAAHWRARHPRWIISTALHSARPRGSFVDLIFLSPVFPTSSHPGRAALGAARASAMARVLNIPVYALGGVDARNAASLKNFAGIAAVGALAA